jgi:predicted  nucleic acid-binding Zn-ribbon protein
MKLRHCLTTGCESEYSEIYSCCPSCLGTKFSFVDVKENAHAVAEAKTKLVEIYESDFKMSHEDALIAAQVEQRITRSPTTLQEVLNMIDKGFKF